MTLFSWASTHNPVMRTELIYQQRSAQGRTRGWFRRVMRWGWMLLLALAVVTSVILLVMELVAVALHYDFSVLPLELYPVAAIALFFLPVIVLIPMTLMIHFRTQLRTLALASNVISREKRGGTWDLLLLTGVDSPQIIRGKWWATIRYVWRDYALLALLRSASIFWLVLEANRITIQTYPVFNFQIRERYYDPSVPHLLLVIGLTLVFTFVNMGYTVAAGTLASAFTRGGGVSLALGIALRTVTLIGCALFVGLSGHFIFINLIINNYATLDYYALPWQSYQAFVSTAITLFDNGSMLAGSIASFNPTTTDSYYRTYMESQVVGGVLTLAILILLTWLALRIAQWTARRQGAIPFHPQHWLKAKKNEDAA